MIVQGFKSNLLRMAAGHSGKPRTVSALPIGAHIIHINGCIMIRRLIKNTLISAYHKGLLLTARIAGADRAKALDARLRFKRKMNIRNPRNLAEKIAWLEFNDPDPRKVTCTDKWEVREYVANKGLSDILVPVYGSPQTSARDFNPAELPDQFVIKATHGCGMNFICDDKSQLNLPKLRRCLQNWLDTTFGVYAFEMHYATIPHRFYIEKYLGDGDAMVDYKFFCYHGKPSFVEVCSNRKSGLRLEIYSMDWHKLDAITARRHTDAVMDRPQNFDRMKEIAATLSADFTFVRVDLYNVGGKIYFSELTFTPATCVLANFKEDFLRAEGKKLALPDR